MPFSVNRCARSGVTEKDSESLSYCEESTYAFCKTENVHEEGCVRGGEERIKIALGLDQASLAIAIGDTRSGYSGDARGNRMMSNSQRNGIL